MEIRRLEEIFDDREDVIMARRILNAVENSPFSEYEVGVPISSILVKINGYNIKNNNYAKGLIAALVEWSYLEYHDNSEKGAPRVAIPADLR
ncbi:hypothetical protein HYV49_01835 [Candidatus Pacearchaeota archaeon]|nr:hypothetical protein [Candidatus Pacearchaeota archaeon]